MLFFVALLCLVTDLVIWGLTFSSPSFNLPTWLFAPFFAFAIVGSVAAVVLAATVRRLRSGSILASLRGIPAWVVGPFLAGAAAIAIGGVHGLVTTLPGQPGYNPSTGQYYFDDHGRVIPTDRVHYLTAVGHQTRGFLSVAIFFTALMLVVAGEEVLWRRQVALPKVAEVPLPAGPRTRLCPAPWISLGIASVGLVAFVAPFQQIVQRVDGYASNAPPVTAIGTTERLTAGPWVVFVRCETHGTDAPYGCPRLQPHDVVIKVLGTNERVRPVVDPSVDHISPDDLPAAGRLTFSVPSPAVYELRLTRPVPKEVFVAESPGSVARSVAWAIVVGSLGIVVVIVAGVLLIRRVRWRLQRAPRVFVSQDGRRGRT